MHRALTQHTALLQLLSVVAHTVQCVQLCVVQTHSTLCIKHHSCKAMYMLLAAAQVLIDPNSSQQHHQLPRLLRAKHTQAIGCCANTLAVLTLTAA
jgi:hypothetical protein